MDITPCFHIKTLVNWTMKLREARNTWLAAGIDGRQINELQKEYSREEEDESLHKLFGSGVETQGMQY